MAHSTKEDHEKLEKDVHEGESLFTYWAIFAALMVLLVITVLVAEVDLNHIHSNANAVVAMTIAVVKALLVVLFFMHVRHGTKLIWIVVSAGFFWLIIFFVMGFVDYGPAQDKIPNGGRIPGNQSGLAYPVSQTPRPDQQFYNPLSPMAP